ncbi:PSMD9 family protein [Megaselia abdita]
MVVPDSNKRQQTLNLIAQKDKIEKQIAEFGIILQNNDNVGMHGPLVDLEGFPRNDIDVHQVRVARNQIICLQNDLNGLLKEIEKGLHEVHAEARENEQGTSLSQKTAGLELSDITYEQSIVKVTLVTPGSPAEDAGLREQDEIIEFGSINHSNFQKDIQKIAQLVKNKENQRIPLKIRRGEETLNGNLIPRNWSGRGLLGCILNVI